MEIVNSDDVVELTFEQLVKGETYRDTRSNVIYQCVKCHEVVGIVALGEGHLYLSSAVAKARRFIHCKSVLTVGGQ